MSFAFDEIELRRGATSMLETHIMTSSLICHLVLILVFCLAHILVLRERTALCLDTLDTAHVLIVVIVSRVGLIFLLEGLTSTLNQDTWMVHVFPVMVHVPLGQMVRCKGL
jgi:hypothetical protein